MFSLLLALLATAPDPQATELLAACDTPKVTRGCAQYLRGFVDAMEAQDYVARFSRPAAATVNVALPSIVCFRGEFDLLAIRNAVVAELKGQSRDPARVRVMVAISRLYPCD